MGVVCVVEQVDRKDLHAVHEVCWELRWLRFSDPAASLYCTSQPPLPTPPSPSLQASMTQLLLYYTRLLELLKKQGPDGLALAREGVNIPAIMYEIKRITKA